jgi:hypothetical protein
MTVVSIQPSIKSQLVQGQEVPQEDVYLCLEIVRNIVSYLPPSDFISCSRVSREWRACTRRDISRSRDAEIFKVMVKHLLLKSV